MSEVVQEPSGAPTASTTGLFVRNATGLVRDITGWDAFNLVFAAVLVPLGFLGIMAFVPEFWPHANLLLAFVIAGPLVAFVGAVYVYFTIIMPRSGGDYVWVSRTLHPGIAFMVNVGFTYGYLTWVAINFNLGVRVMMPSFAYIGGIHSSWLANPTRGEEFAIVTVLTIFYTGLMIVGTRYMARFMSITFFIVWIGVLVWALLMLFGSHSHFVSQWNAHSGATYAGIMAQARKLGFTSAGAISVGTTLYAMVYCFNAITGFQWTGYFAGEVRNVRKNAYLSIFGALVAGIVGYVALTWLVYHYYGTDFMKSLVYMGFGPGTAHYTLGFTPYVSQLLNFLPGGQAFHLVLLVCVFFMAVIWWTPAGFMLGTRNAFAWSFDRIAPERLSETSDRFHTPVWATVFIGCVVELLCFLNIYSNLGGVALVDRRRVRPLLHRRVLRGGIASLAASGPPCGRTGLGQGQDPGDSGDHDLLGDRRRRLGVRDLRIVQDRVRQCVRVQAGHRRACGAARRRCLVPGDARVPAAPGHRPAPDIPYDST